MPFQKKYDMLTFCRLFADDNYLRDVSNNSKSLKTVMIRISKNLRNALKYGFYNLTQQKQKLCILTLKRFTNIPP